MTEWKRIPLVYPKEGKKVRLRINGAEQNGIYYLDSCDVGDLYSKNIWVDCDIHSSGLDVLNNDEWKYLEDANRGE